MYQLLAACALLVPSTSTVLVPRDDGENCVWPTDFCVSKTGAPEFAARYRAIKQACQTANENNVSGLYFIYSHVPLGCCVGCSHTTPYIAIDLAKGYAMFEIGGIHQDAIVAYDFGAVRELPGSRLLFLPDKLSSPTAEEKTFVAIRWDSQRYLVLESEMIDFCNQYNSSHLRGAPFGPAFLRWADRNSPSDGTPKVPDSWKGFLLTHPVEGRVKAVKKLDNENEIPTYQLTLRSTTVEGLKSGMKVWLYRPPLSRNSPYGQSATVVKVETESCIATTHTPGVTKGWGYSTLHQSKRGKLTDPWRNEDEASDGDRSPPRRTK